MKQLSRSTHFTAFGSLLLLLVLPHCSSEPESDADDAAQEDDDNANEHDAAANDDSAPNDAGPDSVADAGQMSTQVDGPTCTANSPCNGRKAQCVGKQHIERVQDVGCEAECGDEPCTGASCGALGEVLACPEGSVCQDVDYGAARSAVCATSDAEDVVLVTTCGNSELDNVEDCDDGNSEPGDGCNEHCLLETNWRCAEPGQACLGLTDVAPCLTDACAAEDACYAASSGVMCQCSEEQPAECPEFAFRHLPALEGTNLCTALDLSADGSTVVGRCAHFDFNLGETYSRAVVWRLGAGVSALPLEYAPVENPDQAAADAGVDAGVSQELSGGLGAVATVTNADGSVVAGFDENYVVFRQVGEDVELLPDAGYPQGLSDDGAVMVGTLNLHAYAWTPEEGTRLLAEPELELGSSARAVSADGSVIGGSVVQAGERSIAARWNLAGELELLPTPEEFTSSSVSAVNGDGSVLVGFGLSEGKTYALRWTSEGCEVLPGDGDSFASAIDASGERIFGADLNGGWLFTGNELQSLQLLLTGAGANLDVWSRFEVSSASADGTLFIAHANYLGTDQPNLGQGAVIGVLP